MNIKYGLCAGTKHKFYLIYFGHWNEEEVEETFHVGDDDDEVDEASVLNAVEHMPISVLLCCSPSASKYKTTS